MNCWALFGNFRLDIHTHRENLYSIHFLYQTHITLELPLSRFSGCRGLVQQVQSCTKNTWIPIPSSGHFMFHQLKPITHQHQPILSKDKRGLFQLRYPILNFKQPK